MTEKNTPLQETKEFSDKKTNSGYLEEAKMDIAAHILIKDKNTGNVLINKRG